MNDESTREPAGDVLAQLALAASGEDKVSPCPPADHLAAFIDGELDADARAMLLAHLDQCAECRGHWREVSDILHNPEPRTMPATSTVTPKHAHDRSGVCQRSRRWLLPLSLAASLSATAVLSLVLLSTSQPLSKQIDDQLAAVALNNPAISQAAQAMPLPWDSAALGFSISVPDQAMRAFGAGVWLARSTLISDQTRLPDALVEASGRPWAATELRAHFEFGRWAKLLWSQLASDSQLTNWDGHRAIAAELRVEFAKDSDSQTTAGAALQALDDIDEALAAMSSGPLPQAQQQLQSRLAITIHRLAPSRL